MKYRTVHIYQCDHCNRDLPGDLMGTFELKRKEEHESPHNGDLYVVDEEVGTFCAECGTKLYQILKEKKINLLA